MINVSKLFIDSDSAVTFKALHYKLLQTTTGKRKVLGCRRISFKFRINMQRIDSSDAM